MVKKAAASPVEEPKPRPKGRPKGSTKKITNVRDTITRTKAIRLFCIECMGFQIGLIKDCPAPNCPLWPFRMGRGQEHTDSKLDSGFYEKKLVKKG